MSETAYHQFKLRMPKELFESLSAASVQANRSVSAEIISRLLASFTASQEHEKLSRGRDAALELSDMLQQRKERSEIMALATGLLATELVSVLFRDREMPPEVRDVVERSKRLTDKLRGWVEEDDAESRTAGLSTHTEPPQPRRPSKAK